jgi:mono/diheme cytochrome c family protein
MTPAKIAFGVSLVFLVSGLALAQKDKPADSQKKDNPYEELTRAPEKARGRRNPLENDPEVRVAGKKLFERHCAECHGEDGSGTKKAPSLRAEEVQGATQGTLFWVLTNGVVRTGMPVWSKLPEAQRWQIVSYVKSLGAPAAPATAKPTSPPR